MSSLYLIKRQAFAECTANVVKFTLGRLAVPPTPGSRSTTVTLVSIIQINRPWPKSISRGHRIQLQDTKILSAKPRYMDRMIREDIEIELHPNDVNRGMSSVWTGQGNPSSSLSEGVETPHVLLGTLIDPG